MMSLVAYGQIIFKQIDIFTIFCAKTGKSVLKTAK